MSLTEKQERHVQSIVNGVLSQRSRKVFGLRERLFSTRSAVEQRLRDAGVEYRYEGDDLVIEKWQGARL